MAIANLKGGVGKSTTTLFFSDYLAMQGHRVLVIDLDPQSNASMMLLSRQGLGQWETARRTLIDFFLDSRQGHVQSALSYIAPNASDLIELRSGRTGGRIDIAPSIPKMWFTSYDFDKFYFSQDKDPADEHVAMLAALKRQVAQHYDYLIFDCPPGFGTLTRAGLRSADIVVSPTVPDPVSQRSLSDFVTLGLKHILRFDTERRHFVIVSRYRGTNNEKAMVDLLLRSHRVLQPFISLRDAMLDATEHIHGRLRTYDQKYDSRLRDEIVTLCDAMVRAID